MAQKPFPPDEAAAPAVGNPNKPTPHAGGAAVARFTTSNNFKQSSDGDGDDNMRRGGPGRLMPSPGTSGPQAHQGPPPARGHEGLTASKSGPAHNGQHSAVPSSRGRQAGHPQGGVMAAMEAQANKLHPVGG